MDFNGSPIKTILPQFLFCLPWMRCNINNTHQPASFWLRPCTVCQCVLDMSCTRVLRVVKFVPNLPPTNLSKQFTCPSDTHGCQNVFIAVHWKEKDQNVLLWAGPQETNDRRNHNAGPQIINTYDSVHIQASSLQRVPYFYPERFPVTWTCAPF